MPRKSRILREVVPGGESVAPGGQQQHTRRKPETKVRRPPDGGAASSDTVPVRPHPNVAEQRRLALDYVYGRVQAYATTSKRVGRILDVGGSHGGFCYARNNLKRYPAIGSVHVQAPITCAADCIRVSRLREEFPAPTPVGETWRFSDRLTGCLHRARDCTCAFDKQPGAMTGRTWLFVHSYYYMDDSDFSRVCAGDRAYVVIHRFDGESGSVGDGEFVWKRQCDGSIVMRPTAACGTTYEHNDVTPMLSGHVIQGEGGVRLEACFSEVRRFGDTHVYEVVFSDLPLTPALWGEVSVRNPIVESSEVVLEAPVVVAQVVPEPVVDDLELFVSRLVAKTPTDSDEAVVKHIRVSINSIITRFGRSHGLTYKRASDLFHKRFREDRPSVLDAFGVARRDRLLRSCLHRRPYEPGVGSVIGLFAGGVGLCAVKNNCARFMGAVMVMLGSVLGVRGVVRELRDRWLCHRYALRANPAT